jgi:hypothetical protein
LLGTADIMLAGWYVVSPMGCGWRARATFSPIPCEDVRFRNVIAALSPRVALRQPNRLARWRNSLTVAYQGGRLKVYGQRDSIAQAQRHIHSGAFERAGDTLTPDDHR